MTQNNSQPETATSDGVDAASATDLAATIATALAEADLNAVRIALFQITGDPELRDMPVESIPIRSGRVWQTVVHHDYQDRLKDIATAYLSREATDAAPPPDRETAIELLNNFTGHPVPADEVSMNLEYLAFEEFPRDVSVTLAPGVKIPDNFHVTIIGAGISGVAVAIQLQRLGICFTIVERLSRFGGTWVANHYPGLRVDVNGLTYQYSFAPYVWRHRYPPQAEILEYFDYIADRYNLRPSATFDTSVEHVTWDDETSRWTVALDNGTVLSSNFVISASGLFNLRHTPNIPGMSSFKGEMFHTGDWDDACNVDGKSVALIGNGSSGTQVMPWIASHANNVYAFQRTPNWIVPPVGTFNGLMQPGLQWLFDHLPYYYNWHLFGLHSTGIDIQTGHEVDAAWYEEHGSLSQHNDTLRNSLQEYIKTKLDGRPDLIEKTMPNQAPLARRLIVDNGWYESLLRPNVELVTDQIANFDETGINTVDGKHYALDAVVLGSGFEVSSYFWPVTYKGVSGITLEDAWNRDGARAYLGLSYPEFPNFFSCWGPNGHPRAGSFHSWSESWARYVSSLMIEMLNRGAHTVEIRREAFSQFNEAIDEKFKTLVWGMVPAGGYYINDTGRPGVHMPYRAHEYHSMLAQPELSDYDFR